MKRRNITRVRPAAPAKAFDQQKIRVLLVSIICVAVVAAGFFFAARQHFATMEFGLKNSQLRKQVENLEAERRRLILAKEVSLSPSSIKQTAAKLGFREQMAAPPSSASTSVEATTASASPSAELASFKPQSGKTANGKDEQKLVKPIVQQAAAKVRPSDERPRIAGAETAVATISAKPLAKLR
jgi:hypothetical protein